jgi:hypothetical protein
VTNHGWLTPGVIEKCKSTWEVTVLTKSRQRTGKSSEGAGGLDCWAIEDDGDKCQVIWRFGPQNHLWTIFGFGPQNLDAVLAGIGGVMWHHREVCVEAKVNHERHMAVGSVDL